MVTIIPGRSTADSMVKASYPQLPPWARWAKATPVRRHASLLVFSPVFGVVAAVT